MLVFRLTFFAPHGEHGLELGRHLDAESRVGFAAELDNRLQSSLGKGQGC
jgi:hypothetical protein